MIYLIKSGEYYKLGSKKDEADWHAILNDFRIDPYIYCKRNKADYGIPEEVYDHFRIVTPDSV